MFSLTQIDEAHARVKTGADFPKYIQEIKQLGVKAFETWVVDSHTVYFGDDAFEIQSDSQYDPLEICQTADAEKFKNYLKIHQQGQTDYYTFCQHCALTGIQKWIVDLTQFTCTYYDIENKMILTEKIPS